jgi:Domain of unknown function (DUF4190)
MVGPQWDARDEAQKALRAIVPTRAMGSLPCEAPRLAPGGYQVGGGNQSPPVAGNWSQPPASGFVPTTRANGLAIASLVLGVLWLIRSGSVISLVLGLMALKQIKTRHQGGRGIAIAGVVLSILWLLVLVVTIIVGVSQGS